jgi:oligopeptide/dipeptide ABC transporter ATP-binding protein
MSEEALLRVEGLAAVIERGNRRAEVVRGVDLSLNRGEMVGLLGESGSGKSMTIRSILGLLPPGGRVVSGRFTWEAEESLELAGLPDVAYRGIRGRRIATVFQDPLTAFNPVRNIGSHIAEVLARFRRIGGNAARNDGLALLEQVGLAEPGRAWRSYPHELSGGMRQRAAIAMALACDPPLLVADEPTTALDVTIQAQVLTLLESICRERAMTVLLITHDLGIVAERCDRAFVMYGGRVVEEGSIDDLLSRSRHPYTRALIGSLPSLTEDRRRLASIPGRPPSPFEAERGCPFLPRCPLARPGCLAALPPFSDAGRGHRSRCPVMAKEPDR